LVPRTRYIKSIYDDHYDHSLDIVALKHLLSLLNLPDTKTFIDIMNASAKKIIHGNYHLVYEVLVEKRFTDSINYPILLELVEFIKYYISGPIRTFLQGVLIPDDYFVIKHVNNNSCYWYIMSKLCQDLQIVLVNRTYGLSHDYVSTWCIDDMLISILQEKK
jgi:hypothetical protein